MLGFGTAWAVETVRREAIIRVCSLIHLRHPVEKYVKPARPLPFFMTCASTQAPIRFGLLPQDVF